MFIKLLENNEPIKYSRNIFMKNSYFLRKILWQEEKLCCTEQFYGPGAVHSCSTSAPALHGGLGKQ